MRSLLLIVLALCGCHHTYVELGPQDGGDDVGVGETTPETDGTILDVPHFTDDSVEDTGEGGLTPMAICDEWSTTPGILPFHPRNLLWVGSVDPYHLDDDMVTVTDKAAMFTAAGYWQRTLYTFKVVLPTVDASMLDGTYRLAWLVGSFYFIAELEEGEVATWAGNARMEWETGVPVEVEIEETCNPSTGQGARENRVNGIVVDHQESMGCEPMMLSAVAFTPGFKMGLVGPGPIEPAYAVDGLQLRFGSFCFFGE